MDPAPSTPPIEPEPPAPRPSPVAATLRSPRGILGLIALAGAAGCTIALLVRDAPEGQLLLGLAAAAAALLGAWLLAWGRPWQLAIPVAVLFLGLATLAFSLRATSFAWPALGLGLGALGAWSYARKHRALIATATLLAAGYAVAAAAGLLMATGGKGHWWIAGQGLGSLLLGLGLLKLGSRPPAPQPEDPSLAPPPSPLREPATQTRLRLAGRLLIVCGVLLPYAALVLLAVGRALQG